MAWTLTPPFMLRVAGMPIDAALRLRFLETVRWAEDALAVEDELNRRKRAVGDALEQAIGGVDDERLRHDLVELRRDVFNLRLPRRPEHARRLLGRLDRDARDRTERWLELRERHERQLASGAAVLAEETDERRAYLRQLAVDPRLRHGLLLASESLDRYLPTYLNAPAGPLGKRARRIERSLLEYVFRAACKTSPFSTLTLVALGHFGALPGQFGTSGSALAVSGIDGERRAHVRLNIAALARLADLIIGSATLRADLPVEVTSGWSTERSRVRYVRRTRVAGDDEAALTFDSMQEDLFFLSQGTVLKEVLGILEECPRIPMAELAERVRLADPEQRDPAEVDTYLRHLLRLGLLTVPSLQIDIHSEDPVASFARGIARLCRPWSEGLVRRLDAVGGRLAGYRIADLDARRQLLGAVRAELADAQRELGVEPVAPPRPLIYEDVCLPVSRVVADVERWRETLLPSLQQLSRILPVFDTMLPHRLTLKGFFLARYGPGGRCADLLNLVHEFHRDVYDQYIRVSSRRRPFDADGEFTALDNWLRVPEIDALTRARRVLVSRMREAYAALPADAPELVLDDDLVEAVAQQLPAGCMDFDPRSYFLQVADDNGRPLGVLNRSYSGLTLLFSRFAHCFDDAGEAGLVGQLRDALEAVRPDGAVFAELTGGYDTTNLNLHPAVTPYELVCPGETSHRPAAAQIRIDDLVAAHDPVRDRVYLHCDRLGVEVIPVYLGFLLPLALPEVQRTLLLFTHTSAAPLDMWGGTDRPLRGETIGGHPRLRYRDLVLVRHTWKLHPNYAPSSAATGTSAEWFLAWQRWRRDNDLPRRVFATIDVAPLEEDPGSQPGDQREPGDAAATTNRDSGRPIRRPIKPQYVDFDSYFSLCLLDNLLRSADRRVVLTEMLPDIDQLWLRAADGRYVTEQTVEITGCRPDERRPVR